MEEWLVQAPRSASPPRCHLFTHSTSMSGLPTLCQAQARGRSFTGKKQPISCSCRLTIPAVDFIMFVAGCFGRPQTFLPNLGVSSLNESHLPKVETRNSVTRSPLQLGHRHVTQTPPIRFTHKRLCSRRGGFE